MDTYRPSHPTGRSPLHFALALSGGGAKCAAQAGVLEVMEEAQLPVGFLTGASAGGLVAVLYGLGVAPRLICDFMANTNLLAIWEPDVTRHGLCGPDKIRTHLQNVVGDKTFADLKIPVTVIATEMHSGREVHLRSGRLDEALLATMAIPGLFTPLIQGERFLADGGIRNPLPVNLARAVGPRVVALDVLSHQPPYGTPVQLFEARGPMRFAAEMGQRLGASLIMEATYRTLVLMSCQIVGHSLQRYPPDVLIQPEVGAIGLFATDLAEVAYQKGRTAAQAALPELQNLVRWRMTAPQTWKAQLRAELRQHSARQRLVSEKQ
jgi:NTE family protein